MMEYKFDNSVAYVCEDTARVLVYSPTEKNKMDIIEFLDDRNYIVAGVYTDNEDTARTFQYYFNCMATKDLDNIKKVE